MSYVDGFVFTLPKRNIPAYRRMAQQGCRIWRKHGALQYVECIGDDLNVKMPDGVPDSMKGILFPKLTRMRAGETVGFSFIVYRSRAHRDAVNKKVMADPIMQKMPKRMPFDPKRMSYGGFKAIVER